jgi:2-oxoglutarate ferredoxin oxidoreductase subunit gamma
MMEKCRLVFSGSGGQGVITAAILLAEAAVLHEGLNAVQSQSYGAQARGGAARSDVIIWDKPVYYPKVVQPNVLVCLTQTAYNKYHPTIRPGGLLITDTALVKVDKSAEARLAQLAFQDQVKQEMGNTRGLNICVLGAVAALTQIVSIPSLESAVAGRFDERFREANLKALHMGIALGSQGSSVSV